MDMTLRDCNPRSVAEHTPIWVSDFRVVQKFEGDLQSVRFRYQLQTPSGSDRASLLLCHLRVISRPFLLPYLVVLLAKKRGGLFEDLQVPNP